MIAANKRNAEYFAKKCGLELRNWVYLHDEYQIRGIDPKSMEFVYLDGWYLNDSYKHAGFYTIIREMINLGASEIYV